MRVIKEIYRFKHGMYLSVMFLKPKQISINTSNGEKREKQTRRSVNNVSSIYEKLFSKMLLFVQ